MIAFRSLVPAAAVLALVGCTTVPTPSPRESAALAVLKSDAGVHEKARACQELADFGGPAAVPALAALLSHEQLSDYARSGLESIPDASAAAALRQALGGLSDRQLAGAVNSLGVRRDSAAVPDLQRLALDPGRGAAAEAVASLGLIGNAAAAQTLQQILASGPADLRLPAAHASLVAAEHLAKAGNTRVARTLLDDVVRAASSGPVVAAAQRQAAALKGR